MTCEEICPRCGTTCQLITWQSGKCGKCGLEYSFDEYFDGDNDWPVLVWDEVCYPAP